MSRSSSSNPLALLRIARDGDVPEELRERERSLGLGLASVRRVEERLREVDELLRGAPPGIPLPEVVLGERELLARDGGTRDDARPGGCPPQAARLVLLAAPARTGIVSPDLLAADLAGLRDPLPPRFVDRIDVSSKSAAQHATEPLVSIDEIGQVAAPHWPEKSGSSSAMASSIRGNARSSP